MTQSKEELDMFYSNADPWGYHDNVWDALRKDIIITTTRRYSTIGGTTIDLGCGEGWITKDLPGALFGIEISDMAATRLHESITRIKEPSGFSRYNMVLACGVLYEQYDWRKFHSWIEKLAASGGHVITCNILEWERNELPKEKMVEVRVFPYREYNQVLRVYKW